MCCCEDAEMKFFFFFFQTSTTSLVTRFYNVNINVNAGNVPLLTRIITHTCRNGIALILCVLKLRSRNLAS